MQHGVEIIDPVVTSCVKNILLTVEAAIMSDNPEQKHEIRTR
jgi:hypothetical protein